MKRPLSALLVLASGCGEISLAALTVPPPGKTALMETKDDHLTLEMSRGIAFAFECTSSGNSYNGPCREATATSDDEGIAAVYPSYLDSLDQAWEDGNGNLRARTAFVVVGLADGGTTVRVSTSDGDVDVELTVTP